MASLSPLRKRKSDFDQFVATSDNNKGFSTDRKNSDTSFNRFSSFKKKFNKNHN